MTDVWQDIKYAVRKLAANPGFAAMVVLSLVLGITLNSAVFGLVDGIWLRSMPFADADRVVRVFASTPHYRHDDLSYPDYLDLQRQMQSVSGLATSDRRGAILIVNDESEDLRADIVSRNFFTVLGIRPCVGRFFSETDEPALKDTPSVVLSHRLWMRRFGGDPNLVGRAIEITGRVVVVLAVAAPGFGGLERLNPADLWYPIENYGMDAKRDERYISVFGRLKPGATVAQSQAEAQTIFRRLDLRDSASHSPLGAVVQTEASLQFERTGILGLLLLGFVGTVLLLACVNVACLMLARMEVRTMEMTMRAALGASRWRLVRQSLIESLLLASAALAVSLLLARWLVVAWPALLPADAAGAIAQRVRWDGRVVTFTCVLSLASVLLFGLVPALRASRLDLAPAIKGEGRRGTSGRGIRGLNLLVAGQATVALVLVTVAGLLTRSLLAYYTADLGFEKKEILLVNLSTGNEEHGRMVHRQLKEKVLALPGVRRTSVARVVPFSPSGLGASKKVFPLNGPASLQEGWSVRFNAIDSDYLELLGIPVVRGRGFDERDDASAARVMLINETMARNFWPNEDPIGQFVRLDNLAGGTVQIVGVVRDTKIVTIDETSEPYLFLPLAQHYHYEAILLADSAVDAATLVGPVREELKLLGLKPTGSDIRTMSQYIRIRLSSEEFLAKIAGGLSLLDLGLAALGLYGVLAYAVNRRTREIGIRMTLGARRRDVLLMVLRRGLTLPAFGAALGVPIALIAGYAIRSLLYGVHPLDPLSIVVSLGMLAIVAFVACWVPACRATRVDPMTSLRCE
ncbi:MAG: ABC transporter permease [Solirubrobacterales bacterium]